MDTIWTPDFSGPHAGPDGHPHPLSGKGIDNAKDNLAKGTPYADNSPDEAAKGSPQGGKWVPSAEKGGLYKLLRWYS